MNEMFTERARRAIEYARDEAARLKHDYIGTEHLLLGLIRLGEGSAAEILQNIGVELNELKKGIEEIVQPSGGTMQMGQLPLTARAKKTLEISGNEARALKSKDIDTEHILLALLKDEEGVASQVLSMYDIDYKEVYEELQELVVHYTDDKELRDIFDSFELLYPDLEVLEETEAAQVEHRKKLDRLLKKFRHTTYWRKLQSPSSFASGTFRFRDYRHGTGGKELRLPFKRTRP